MAEIKVGDYVAAKKFGPLEHDFSGEVTKVYENSVLIEIKEFDPADKTAVGDMNNRAVVRKTGATVTKAAEETPVDPTDSTEDDPE